MDIFLTNVFTEEVKDFFTTWISSVSSDVEIENVFVKTVTWVTIPRVPTNVSTPKLS